MIPFYYEATDLSDAWTVLIYNIFDEQYARKYIIEKGSYEGHIRLEYFWAIVRIKYPHTRPFLIVPDSVEPPTNDQQIEEYFTNYLMDDSLEKNELYRYSTSIKPQLDKIIEMLGNSPDTNQACMSIGSPASINLNDPECLRLLDWRVINNTLYVYVYFRSNDLYSAWVTNIAGIQLLKEFICEMTGLKDGEILYSSKGLHLYEHAVDSSLMRLNKQKITESW